MKLRDFLLSRLIIVPLHTRIIISVPSGIIESQIDPGYFTTCVCVCVRAHMHDCSNIMRFCVANLRLPGCPR